MANYNNLKAGIDAVIKTNGRQEISGAALNTQLKNMITELGAGYQYMGVATPATNPGTPDANVFYLASEAGTYTNFGGIVINDGEVCALVWNGTWTKEVTGIASADKLNQLGQQVEEIPIVSVSQNTLTIGNQNYHSAGIGTQTEQNGLVGGFASKPVNIDNTNSKFVWSSTNYFRINGRQYSVQADELAFSSYSGGQTALALVLSLTDELISPDVYRAYYEIVANSSAYSPNAFGRYVVAWFYRSGASWSDGPVNSVISNLPFTIDGKKAWEQINEQNYLLNAYCASPVNIDNTQKKIIWSENVRFHVNGKRYLISPGELAFSSYTGLYNLIALSVELTDTQDSNLNYLANFVLTAQSPTSQPSGVPYMDGKFTVAWLYRTTTDWSTAVIRDVAFGGLEFTIDGQHKYASPQKVAEAVEKSSYKLLELGTFLNVGSDSNGLPGDASTTRTGGETTMALPYNGVTVKIHAPEYYCFGFRSGVYGGSLPGQAYWFFDGDTYTFPQEYNYYRPTIFKRIDGVYQTISAQEVNTMIANGLIYVTYEGIDAESCKRNTPSDNYAKAIIQKFTSVREDNGIDKFPIFLHTTDIHGDIYRLKDAIALARTYNADALLVTGDVNAYTIKNGFAAFRDKLVNCPVPALYCRGNHETYGNSDASFDVFAHYYQDLAEKWDYLLTAGNESNKTYYYKDFATKKIRIIVLNPYENNITSNNAGAISQGQIDWFISTLNSTPEDYGVVCILHSPEAYPATTQPIEPITGKDSFFAGDTFPFASAPTGINGKPLQQIIDAFISKTTLVTSFTQLETGGVSATIDIDADFSSVNSGVEFIAWVCGHEHKDFIGKYKDTTNTQIVLNMTCGVCYYGGTTYPHLNDTNDLPRGPFGVTQDAINLYAIDRVNKQIRIARIGSNMNYELSERKYLILDYV